MLFCFIKIGLNFLILILLNSRAECMDPKSWQILFPAMKDTLQEPSFTIDGRAGSYIQSFIINSNRVEIEKNGQFHFTIHLPNEAGVYEITVTAIFKNNQEETRKLLVTYLPPDRPLSLQIFSPKEQDVICQNFLLVSGRTQVNADVKINDAPTEVNDEGEFKYTLKIEENSIGDFKIHVTASSGEKEITQIIAVEVYVTCPEINLSHPEIFTKVTGIATKSSLLPVSVLDGTPHDGVVLYKDFNGIKDQLEVEVNTLVEIELKTGKNSYTLYAKDRAGNISNVLNGEMISLPTPPALNLLQPDQANAVVDVTPYELEIEVDDGAGDNPENILYVKATVGGKTTVLRRSRYIYMGRIDLKPGTNQVLLMTEDVAGNITHKGITLTLSE